MPDFSSILDWLEVYYSTRYSSLATGSNGRTKAPFWRLEGWVWSGETRDTSNGLPLYSRRLQHSNFNATSSRLATNNNRLVLWKSSLLSPDLRIVSWRELLMGEGTSFLVVMCYRFFSDIFLELSVFCASLHIRTESCSCLCLYVTIHPVIVYSICLDLFLCRGGWLGGWHWVGQLGPLSVFLLLSMISCCSMERIIVT
jgi:hypothetical protein